VSALDDQIDDLYKRPLNEFTGARNALAKTLKGDEAARVKALAKPTVVPWAVNQVYWRARATYDRLMKSGEKLRSAQIAALEGRQGDVRGAGDAHRRAIGDAVAEAERLSAPSGAKPGADALARTFEAMSLTTAPPEAPGRLTEALQPAGFEALAGLGKLEVRSEKSEVKGRKLELAAPRVERATPDRERQTKAESKAAARAAEEAARAAAARQQHEAEVKEAAARLARAEMTERAARDAWERAHDDLLTARQTLADVKKRKTLG
jgi:hypothetical protein